MAEFLRHLRSRPPWTVPSRRDSLESPILPKKGRESGEGRTAEMLDLQATEIGAQLTTQQRALIFEWQKTDRTYERIQAYHREGDCSVSKTVADADQLSSMIARSRLPAEVVAYRGIRNFSKAFGFPIDVIEEYVGVALMWRGMTAVFISKRAALSFTVPDQGNALLQIRIPKRAHALWVAGLGDPTLRHQGELLLDDRTTFAIRSYRNSGAMVEVELEVI